MNAHDLSVITVTFRDPEGLGDTLASIGAVGLTGCEVIVVHGEDSPAPLDEGIASKLSADGNAVSHLPGPDRGPYHAMNKGVMHSTRRWLWFMNSGDIFDHAAVEFLQEARLADEPWAVGSWRIADELSRVYRPLLGMNYFAKGHVPCHQAVLFRRDAFAEVGLYDERYSISADYDVMLALAATRSPHVFVDSVCIYQGGGLSDRRRTTLQVQQQLVRQRRLSQRPIVRAVDWLRIVWRAARMRVAR